MQKDNGRWKVNMPLEKNDENYESDNYSAGYNQACREWKE